MDIRKFLESGKLADALIQSDLEELGRLRGMLTSLQSLSSAPRVAVSGGREAGFVRTVEKIEALEEKINREIDEYVDKKEQIRVLILSVTEPACRLCLQLRYMEFATWPVIAEKMNYSERQIYRLHEKGIALLEEQYRLSSVG